MNIKLYENKSKEWQLEDSEDCEIITQGKYNCLKYHFPIYESIHFGILRNTKGHKYCLIKTRFKEELEQQGWL